MASTTVDNAWLSPSLTPWSNKGKDQISTAGPLPIQEEARAMLKPYGILTDPLTLKKQGDVGFNYSNLDQLNSRLNGIQLDKRGLESLRDYGLSTGDSAWGKNMLEKQALDERVAGDRAVQQNMSGAAQARGALATSGGLSQGARERIAKDSARGLSTARQENTLSGIGSRLGIRTQDEANRLDVLKSLPGMEVQALQPELQKTTMWGTLADSESNRRQGLDLANRNYSTDVDKFNTANTLAATMAENQAKIDKYKTQMEAYGAAKSADAQANSGKK